MAMEDNEAVREEVGEETGRKVRGSVKESRPRGKT